MSKRRRISENPFDKSSRPKRIYQEMERSSMSPLELINQKLDSLAQQMTNTQQMLNVIAQQNTLLNKKLDDNTKNIEKLMKVIIPPPFKETPSYYG